MKKIFNTSTIALVLLVAGILILPTSCKKDLLDQTPTGELAAVNFWKTDADATTPIMSADAAARAVFDRD